MAKLKDLKIGTKMIGGFALVTLTTLIIGFVAWNSVKNLDGNIEEIAFNRLPSADALRTIDAAFERINVAQRTLLNPELNDEDHKRQFENIDEAREEYQKAWKSYETLAHTKEEDELWKQLVPSVEEWKKNNIEFARLAHELAATGIRNPVSLKSDFLKFRGDHYVLLDKLSQYLDKNKQFEGGVDPTACNFGKWLSTFKTGNTEINRLLAEIRPIHNKVHAGVQTVKELMAKGDKEAAIKYFHGDLEDAMEKTFDLFENMHKEVKKSETLYSRINEQAMVKCLAAGNAAMVILDKIIEINSDIAQKSGKEAEEYANTTKTIAVAAMIIGTLLAALIGVALTLAITRPLSKGVAFVNAVAEGDVSKILDIDQKDEIGMLAAAMNGMVENLRKMVRIAERIADGDLTVEVTAQSEKDSLGNALKHMVAKLSGVVSEINVSANNVAAGSEQMSSTSQSMSQGATEQASSLEEISSSMNEIASQTKRNAENAVQANKLAGEARDSAEKGNTQMTQMVTAMSDINQSSQNISKIIKVIDEIAFQTNLLALNAAVEAARAGKHGKGFAVVAEEVRNLAARSAKAAKETAELIEGSVKKVEGGTEIASRTAEALKEIVAAASKVNDLVAEIAAASNEQAQGVSQITQGLGQVDQVTQQNTAHAEESASAAEELSSQAMVLQQLVGNFKLADDKAALRTAPAAHTQPQTAAGKKKPSNKAVSGWGSTHAVASAVEPVINLDDQEPVKH